MLNRRLLVTFLLSLLIVGCSGCSSSAESTKPAQDISSGASSSESTGIAASKDEVLDKAKSILGASFSYPDTWFVITDEENRFQVKTSDSTASAFLAVDQFDDEVKEADLLAFAEGVGQSNGVIEGSLTVAKCKVSGLTGVKYEYDIVISGNTYKNTGISISDGVIIYSLLVGYCDDGYRSIASKILDSFKVAAEAKDVASNVSGKSESANQTAEEGVSESSVESNKPSVEQSNALRTAKDYLKVMPFSRIGLIEQLEFEGYSHEAAEWASDNCGADWMKEAEKSAADYLDLMGFSRNELIEQLEFEGYTYEEAVHGVDSVGL